MFEFKFTSWFREDTFRYLNSRLNFIMADCLSQGLALGHILDRFSSRFRVGSSRPNFRMLEC
jgi:hypothetical protein